MYLFFLFASLFCIFILYGKRLRGDVGTPSLISIGIVAFASFIAFLNSFYWQRDITIKSLFILLASLIFQIIGNEIALANKCKKDFPIVSGYDYKINRKFNRKIVVFAFVSIGTLLYSIKWNGQILDYLGYSFRSSRFLFFLRHKEALGFYDGAPLQLILLTYFVIGGSYSLIVEFIEGLFAKRLRFKSSTTAFFALAIAPVFGLEFFSTGREGFIRLFSLVIIVILCYMRKTITNRKKLFYSGIKKMGITAILAIFVFLISGIFTGKTQKNSIFDSLSVYVASPIVAFDVKINDNSVKNEQFRSFWGAYRLIDKIKGERNITSRSDEFVTISANGTITNIYSSFYDYYSDFGIIGLCIIQLLFGLFMGVLYEKTKGKNHKFWILIYSFYGYSLTRQITEAYFLKMFFTVTHALLLFSALVGFEFFCRDYRNVKEVKCEEEVIN